MHNWAQAEQAHLVVQLAPYLLSSMHGVISQKRNNKLHTLINFFLSLVGMADTAARVLLQRHIEAGTAAYTGDIVVQKQGSPQDFFNEWHIVIKL